MLNNVWFSGCVWLKVNTVCVNEQAFDCKEGEMEHKE